MFGWARVFPVVMRARQVTAKINPRPVGPEKKKKKGRVHGCSAKCTEKRVGKA